MGTQSTTWGLSRSEIAKEARRMARPYKSFLRRNLGIIRDHDGDKAAALSGRIVWQGESLINHEPVMVVMTNYARVSENIKTGPMVQFYIFTEKEFQAMAKAICGGCAHSKAAPGKRPACYVQWARLNHAWTAAKKNKPLSLNQACQVVKGMRIRLGAAGDPCAVPLHVWQQLASAASGHTGYTHQWHKEWAQAYSELLMASVDSASEGELATAMGWRWFGVESPGNSFDRLPSVRCLSEASDIACINCMLCNGNANLEKTGRRAPNIVITAHGPGAKNVKARIP